MRVLVAVEKWPWPTSTGSRVRIAELWEAFAEDDRHLVVWGDEDRAKGAESVEEQAVPHDLVVGPLRERKKRLAELVSDIRPAAIWASGPWIGRALANCAAPLAVDVPSLTSQLIRNEMSLRMRSALSASDRHRLLTTVATAPSRLLQERRAWKQAALLTACSPRVIDDMASWARKRSIFVPSGCDPRHFSTRTMREPRLLFVGTLHYPPNAEAAVLLAEQILPQVAESCPEVRLDLVGAGPPQLVRKLSGLEGVSCHGFVPDLAEFYGRDSLAVIPLVRSSGTNIKVLEAMAFGLPVVTTSISVAGLPALRPGIDLEVVRRWQDCSGTVTALLRDPSRRDAMAQSAHLKVLEHYSWDAIRVAFRSAIGEIAKTSD